MNALKTTSARIRSATSELTEMGEEVDDLVTSTSKYRAEIKALSGVDIMESDGTTYRSIYNILKDIAEVYDSLSDINKAQLLEDLAGKRNAQVLASIITNLDDLTGSYEASQNAAGTLAKANATYLDSVQGKLNQFSASYEQLSMKLFSSNVIKTVISALRGIVDIFNSIDDATDGISTATIELTALITILPSLIATLKKTEAITNLGVAIKGVNEGLLSLAGKILPSLKTGLSVLSGSLLGALGTFAAVAVAIWGLATVFKNVREDFPTFSDKKEDLAETRSDISDIESELEEVQSRLEELNGIENPTFTEQEEIDKLKAENEQLQRKLKLKKALEEQQSLEAEELFVKGDSYKFNEENTKYQNGYAAFLRHQTQYQTSKGLETDAIERGDVESADYWADKAEEAKASMQDIYETLSNLVEESGIEGETEGGQEILDTITNMEVALASVTGISSDASSAISSVLNEFKFEPLQAALEQMKQAGTISAETIQKMYEEGQKIAETGADLENPNYLLTIFIETLGKLLNLDLTSGTDGFNLLADALKDVGEAAGNATQAVSSIDYDTVDAQKSKVDAVTGAMKEYKQYNGLTTSSVKELTSAFPALLSALYDSEGKLTAQGKAALASNSAMLTLVRTTMTAEKCINGMNLAEAKAELASLRAEILKTISSMSLVENMSTDTSGNARPNGNKLRGLQTKAGTLEQQITARESEIDSLYSSLNSNFTSSSSKSSSSTDTFKSALEKQLKILKHQLEMEKITYEEYYAGVAKIRDKYQAKNATKYQEEIWDLEQEIFQGRLTTFQDFVSDYNTVAENQFDEGKVLAARTTYDQILDETQKMIDWGVSYGLSENGDFMQTVRKQWKDTCQAIMDMIDQVYDEYESYLDTFDLWGTGAGKSGIVQTDYYEQWLKELKQAYQKGLMEYEDYVTAHNEIAGKLYDTQKSSIDEIINMTIDMLKQESEDMIDAIDDQIDAYEELISLKKELLEQTNDEIDHEEEVADLVSEIAELQSKIAQLSLDDSREAAAKREDLEEQLADKQKELAQNQRDYGLNQTTEALDKEQEAYEKEKDSEKEILEDSVDDWMTLYRKAIKLLNSDWEDMYSQLQAYNEKYCNSIDGINSLKTAWENVDAVVKQYGYDIEAARNSGSDLGIAPTNPTTSYLVNNGVNEEGVKSVVSRMRANMNAWHVAYANGDKTEQKRLSDENLQLGSSLAQYGLKVVRDEPTGVWYIDHIGGTRLFDKYHSGGVVGNQATSNDREVLALLEKGELVLDDKKKQSLFAMFDQLSAVAGSMAANKLSYRVGNMDTKAGDVFAPSVAVTINHDGNMSDDDARRYGQLTADTVLEKLRTAFNRRGM